MGTTLAESGRGALLVLIWGSLWSSSLKSGLISRRDAASRVSLRNHVMIVIPKPDHRLRKIVFITKCAKAGRTQQEILARASQSERQPAGGQNANEVSVGKQQYVRRNRAETLEYAVRARAYLRRRFAARGAVAEQLPVGMIGVDFGRAQSLILTVVPLHQVRIGFGHPSKSGQLAGSGGAPKRAGKHLGKGQALQTLSKALRVALPVWSQG